MSDLYTVHFGVCGEPTWARLEIREHAVELAEELAAGDVASDVSVTDELDTDEGGNPKTIWPEGDDE